jgi:hypothetical protein
MSSGLGRIERAILDLIEADERIEDFWECEALANEIYGSATHAQRVAVLRAMHTLARKYPDKVALAGGKGSEPLWIGDPTSIADYVIDAASDHGEALIKRIKELLAKLGETNSAVTPGRARSLGRGRSRARDRARRRAERARRAVWRHEVR